MDFFIHIGTGKTGTSAIQGFLNRNRSQLIEQFSCLYPNLHGNEESDCFLGNCVNHCDFFGSNNNDFIHNQIGSLIKKAESKKIRKIIISCEALTSWPKFAHSLHETLSVFPNIRTFIIVYLRRQDHWLESAWKEWGVKDKNFRDIDHFLSNYQQVATYNYDPLEVLETWEREFSSENIIVQPYEKEQLPDGIIIDFLKKTGIDYTQIQGYDPERDKFYVNVGFNRDIIEIFQLNKNFFQDLNDNRLHTLFSKYLDDTYRKAPFEDYSIFSPQRRLDLLAHYLPKYEVIAKKYLKRSDGKLFYESLPDPNEPWSPYEGLTVEKIVPIFTQIICNMESKQQKHNMAFKNRLSEKEKKSG
jgi:hypothetical protein